MIVIQGSLPTLNQYINAERSSKYAAANLKKSATDTVMWQAKTQTKKIDGLNGYVFHWYVKNKRADPDNISFGAKAIFDGLVKAGIIENDGWQQIYSIGHRFEVGEPRVEIHIQRIQT